MKFTFLRINMNENFLFALALTTLAGLSTGIGGIISCFAKRENYKFLTISLGFSAGVMIYVSFVEILQESIELSAKNLDGKFGEILPILAFFAGIAIIAIIDKAIPQEDNPHEFSSMGDHASKKLMRTGIFTALAIAIHNFPEGLATFISAYSNPQVAIAIAFAIALHNIPEGIAVASPIYQATGSKKKAIFYSFSSGLAEPIGGIIGFLLLMPFLNDVVLAVVFAVVAGIMVYISIDELLPAAETFGEHHLGIGGFVAGMAVMALSLLIL
ncbi:zinc transporter ZupT [Campylobacter geochelonis]